MRGIEGVGGADKEELRGGRVELGTGGGASWEPEAAGSILDCISLEVI